MSARPGIEARPLLEPPPHPRPGAGPCFTKAIERHLPMDHLLRTGSLHHVGSGLRLRCDHHRGARLGSRQRRGLLFMGPQWWRCWRREVLQLAFISGRCSCSSSSWSPSGRASGQVLHGGLAPRSRSDLDEGRRGDLWGQRPHRFHRLSRSRISTPSSPP